MLLNDLLWLFKPISYQLDMIGDSCQRNCVYKSCIKIRVSRKPA